jgi:hypothetical protein
VPTKSSKGERPATQSSRHTPLAGELAALFDAQRRANRRLYSALHHWISVRGRLVPNPPPSSYTQLRSLIEKSFELSKQAEVKIQVLLSRLGSTR